MSEKQPTKSPDLSSFPRGAISIKGLPLSRNARLPSIRTPRDLTLGAQPKRVFMPNIPVRREKKNILNVEAPSPIEHKFEKKSPVIPKRKQRNVIQTEGSLFGEGVAPGPSRFDRQRERECVPRTYPRRSMVKKEIDMSEIQNDINELLKENSPDDDEDEDDDEIELKPMMFPVTNDIENIKKENVKPEVFENDLAKEMGYDINKIAKFIKKEKDIEEAVAPAPKTEIPIPSDSPNELLNLFKSGDTQLLLMDFPSDFNVVQNEEQTNEDSNGKNKSKSSLSVLPEGPIGKLQFLKSGRVRIKIGENYFYLNKGCDLKTKHEVVSIRTDSENGDIMVMGNIEHRLIATPNPSHFLKGRR